MATTLTDELHCLIQLEGVSIGESTERPMRDPNYPVRRGLDSDIP
jgi:hypothetical protein